MDCDFSGWATKASLQCTDGRTIMPGAFKHQHMQQVPLVWQHGHTNPENILGHAILEDRGEEGTYAYCFFNGSNQAKAAAEAVEHKDIRQLSIWANQLIERSKRVMHGAIREVSLVISGANPGAYIENVTIRHTDLDGEEVMEVSADEAVIHTGLDIELDQSDGQNDVKPEEKDEVNKVTTETDVKHAEGDAKHAEGDDRTIQDVIETMNEEQTQVLQYLVGEAVAGSPDVKQSDLGDDTDDDKKEGKEIMHNVFEGQGDDKGKKADAAYELTHSDLEEIMADAESTGSLKRSLKSFALSHGITDIDVLFPDAVAIDKTPEFLKRRTEWVGKVLGSARKSPFSRIKTLAADLTEEEARAKGYITGELKKEEFFTVSKRETTPTTVYKKQKLDRDDMVDITDFDVVAWLRGEMRLMLDEEIARAILIGDGRDIASDDKINEQNIRPIATDHELYTVKIYVNLDDASSSVNELVDAVIANRHFYKGSGMPTMFASESTISRFLLLRDTLGRRIYKNLEELATELRVSEIVAVEVMEEEPTILAIFVNMNDYVVGATAGGQVSLFDDFDIDYNQYKYLIETRMCGALVKLKSAMVVIGVESTDVLVSPEAPDFDELTGEITINDTVGVVYKDSANATVTNGGSPYTVAAGDSETITATPAAGYYFATSEEDSWTFSMPA